MVFYFKRQSKFFALLFVVFFIILAFGSAKAQSSTPLPPDALKAWVHARLGAYHDWINAPWSGDDAPYQAMRRQIDQVLAKGQTPEGMLKIYEAQLAKDPKSPTAFFGRTYAAYRLATWQGNIDKTEAVGIIGSVFLVIAKDEITLPHTYNYARLVFLCENYNGTPLDISAIGARLLHQDPNDLDVEYDYAEDLNVSHNPADRAQALSTANELVKRYPKDAKSYLLLGFIDYVTAYSTHDQSEADSAISQYQHALSLQPANSQDSKTTQLMIESIQQAQLRWKNGPSGG